jgi:ribosomal protein S18 acetylase RimI-like enzyme
VNIRPFVAADETAVIELWQRCDLVRPWNDPRKDIRRKLRVRPDLFLVGDIEGKVVATVMAGYEGHRGWINYLAVAPEHRRRGLGRMMMREAERRLLREGCAKINLQVRAANREAVEFYKRVGFMVDDVISLGRRLENDKPAGGSSRATGES